MTVSIGEVVLNEGLYLEGIENEAVIAVSKDIHLAGTATIQTMPLSGGRQLTLTTVAGSGSTVGRWCQIQIDAIKIIERAGVPVTLVYRDRGSFNVLITKTNFKQFNHRELITPAKWY